MEILSNHAIARMFERHVYLSDVENCLNIGIEITPGVFNFNGINVVLRHGLIITVFRDRGNCGTTNTFKWEWKNMPSKFIKINNIFV